MMTAVAVAYSGEIYLYLSLVFGSIITDIQNFIRKILGKQTIDKLIKMCNNNRMSKKLTKREQFELVKKDYHKWLGTLGLNINVKTGHIIKSKRVSKPLDISMYKVRDSIPTSDRIVGNTYRRYYSTSLPEGKTISIAYNKGGYQVVDAKDFKSMGRKV